MTEQPGPPHDNVFGISDPPAMSVGDTTRFFVPHSQNRMSGLLPPQSHSPHNMPLVHSHTHAPPHGHLIERPHSTPPGALRHTGMSHADILQSDLSRGSNGLDHAPARPMPEKLQHQHGSGNQTTMSTIDQMLATPNSRLAWRNANEELILRGHQNSRFPAAPVGLATSIQASIQSLQQSVAGTGDDMDHSGLRKNTSKGYAQSFTNWLCIPPVFRAPHLL